MSQLGQKPTPELNIDAFHSLTVWDIWPIGKTNFFNMSKERIHENQLILKPVWQWVLFAMDKNEKEGKGMICCKCWGNLKGL